MLSRLGELENEINSYSIGNKEELENFRIRFSDRKVLNSLLDFAGIPRQEAHDVFRVLDKLEKIGLDGITQDLTGGRVDASGDRIPGLGMNTGQVDRIRAFLALPKGRRKDVLSSLAGLFRGVESAPEALPTTENTNSRDIRQK